MMRATVLGANGMLGSDVVKAGRDRGIGVAGLDAPEIDISDYSSLAAAVPDCEWVVNCAAYTDVEAAESDRDEAFRVNCDGARNVARLCAERRFRLVHMSTDYVFDGTLRRPYRETDAPNPINAYGESKLAGERAALETGARCVIVRSQALFGVGGRNFVRTVMERLADEARLRVVADEVTCPTYTAHLADAIMRLMATDKAGIVNISASGCCTRFEQAAAIARRVRPDAVIESVVSGGHGSLARRPAYSALDKALYRQWTGHEMPLWEQGLDAYLAELRC